MEWLKNMMVDLDGVGAESDRLVDDDVAEELINRWEQEWEFSQEQENLLHGLGSGMRLLAAAY